MDTPTATAWLFLMFPLVYSPGPANTLFASNSALFGFRKTLPFMMGINISFAAQSLLVGLGFNKFIEQFPYFLPTLKVFGILYIAWLAWGFFKSKKGMDLKDIKCLRIQDGLLLTFLNPKAWIMQIMMFSQFFTAEESAVRIIELTLLLSLLNLSGHAVWILFGDLVLGRATSLLTPHRQNLLFGTMLLLSIGLML